MKSSVLALCEEAKVKVLMGEGEKAIDGYKEFVAQLK